MAKKSEGLSDNAKIGMLIAGIVVILGFMVFRVLGAMKRPNQNTAVATAPVTASSAVDVAANTPSTGVPLVSLFDPSVNPFRVTVDLSPRARSGTSDTTSSSGAGNEFPGNVIEIDPGTAPLLPNTNMIPVVRLSGVIIDSNPAAYIVRGDKTDLLSVGDELTNGYRIVSIQPDGIRVKKADRSVRIVVGQYFNGVVASFDSNISVDMPQIQPLPKKGEA